MGGRAALRALVAGFGAGLVLTATMLALRLWLDAPSFPERIDDLALRLIPRALFSATIDRFGFSAKPLLFVGIVAGQVLAATVGGLLYGWVATALAARLDLTNPTLGGAIGFLLGIGLDLVILPVLGAGSPVARLGWPSAASALVLATMPGLAYGVALAILLRLASPPRPVRDPLTGTPVARGRVTRRAAVGLLLPVGGALVTIGSLRRLVSRMSPIQPGNVAQVPLASTTTTGATVTLSTIPSPTPPAPVPPTATIAPPTLVPSASAGALASPTAMGVAPTSPATVAVSPTVASPLPTVAPTPTATSGTIPPGVAPLVTPTERFYVIAKDFFAPVIAGESWQLTVGGLVDQPQTLRYADLLALPAVSLAATLECIGNEAGGQLISTAVWSGVPLGTLLAGAAVRPGATHVVFTCADDYVEILPLDRALDSATLLVHTMNGAPLTAQHGFPARLFTAGRFGMKNPKWVVKIAVTGRPIRGYWTERGWDPDAPIEVLTRIDTPTFFLSIPPRPTIIGGVAFAGDRGIARVEVSTDDGATWRAAQLEPALSPLTWVRWAIPWEPPEPGRYTLVARAYEADGTPQIAENRKPGPGGATGYGRVTITVAP